MEFVHSLSIKSLVQRSKTMEVLNTVIFALLLFTDGSFAFQVDGVITMNNTTDVSAGDSVFFTFSVNIELTSENKRLLIVFAGDTLEFSNQTQVEAVSWLLTESTGTYSYVKDSSNLETTEMFYTPFNKQDSYLAYLVNVSSGLHLGKWVFSGSYQMLVTDDVTGGSLIRSVMTLTVLWATNEASTGTVSSNYYMIPMAAVSADAMSSLTQPIMGLFTAQITIQSSRGIQDCSVHVYTSPENISKEVRLTVQKLSISINDTSGTTSDTISILENLNGWKMSTLGSYQNNMAVMMLPTIPIDVANFSDVTVASDLTVRVEDYIQLKSGDTWPVDMGVSFSRNMIWVGFLEVNISAPEVSLPDLTVDVQQTEECAYDGNTTAILEVLVGHSTNSTGTAYNVTVNVYLPDYMTMRKYVFTFPLENTITVRQDMNIVVAEIARLTFSDPFTLELTLDLNLTSLQVLEASNRIVTVETVYGDRWGNETDILSEPVYLNVEVSRVCSKPLTWTTPGKCTCAHDVTLTNCGCCVTGACQCGEVRPQACTPCQEKWRCAAYKEGFEELLYIPKSDVRDSIRCDSVHMRRGSATGVSCQKILSTSPPKYLELSPRVAVVTGFNSVSGILYGISNNGLAYVISRDAGTTWTSVMDEVYFNMTSDPMFIRANISQVG